MFLKFHGCTDPCRNCQEIQLVEITFGAEYHMQRSLRRHYPLELALSIKRHLPWARTADAIRTPQESQQFWKLIECKGYRDIQQVLGFKRIATGVGKTAKIVIRYCLLDIFNVDANKLDRDVYF
jgi:hypothetical protein